MRALESGRVLLRVTNTGVSSVIDRDGKVLQISPQFKRHVITADVQPYKGATPYVMWGNYLLVAGGMLLLGWLSLRDKKQKLK
jgi:apolipoprotein N-acyltransferase